MYRFLLAVFAFILSPLVQASVPPIQKVMIIVLENESRGSALSQPFFGQLARNGAYFSNFWGVARPSQPNYIAMTSGNIHGVVTNNSVNLPVPNIVDLLEAKGKTWKAYADSYPGNCFLEARSGAYVRKHNPFVSYVNIQNNPARCARIVPATELQKDIETDNLPNYSFFVPDLNNDGHDTGVEYADQFLAKTFGPLILDSRFMKDLLLIVTFDEGGWFTQNIDTVFYGKNVRPGVKSNARYDHYSLLRTIEDGMGLGTLKQKDMTASPIEGIWKSQ